MTSPNASNATVCLEVYAFNVRMHLVENSLDSPATGHAPEDSKCATPARTFLNTDSCSRGAAGLWTDRVSECGRICLEYGTMLQI